MDTGASPTVRSNNFTLQADMQTPQEGELSYSPDLNFNYVCLLYLQSINYRDYICRLGMGYLKNGSVLLLTTMSTIIGKAPHLDSERQRRAKT